MEKIPRHFLALLWVLPFACSGALTTRLALSSPQSGDVSPRRPTQWLVDLEHPSPVAKSTGGSVGESEFTALHWQTRSPSLSAPSPWSAARSKRLHSLWSSAVALTTRARTKRSAGLIQGSTTTGPGEDDSSFTQTLGVTGIKVRDRKPTSEGRPIASHISPRHLTPDRAGQEASQRSTRLRLAQTPTAEQEPGTLGQKGPTENTPHVSAHTSTLKQAPSTLTLGASKRTTSTSPKPPVQTPIGPIDPAQSKPTHPAQTTGSATSVETTVPMMTHHVVSTRHTTTAAVATSDTDATPSTSKVTARKPVPRPGTRNPEGNRKGSHGTTAAASIIGGALVLMLIGIFVIAVRKRHREQSLKVDPAWAGPTPFLDGNIQPSLPGSGVKLRASSRISVQSFLPQRLSKRLSFLKMDEQLHMEDLQQVSTFGTAQDPEPKPGNGGAKEQGNAPDQAQTNSSNQLSAAKEEIPTSEAVTPPPPPPPPQMDIPPAPLLDIDLGPPIEEEISPTAPCDAPPPPTPPPLPSS